ncbi:MAG: hypothetical protein LC798_13630 [Chloroflexi bacterium]|nr:hypothetical protein [Chloroflexota bacterium]
MSRLPWYPLFPADWRGDVALQSCSLAARGLWFEMMNLMHDGEPYGHLTTSSGAPISPPLLAKLVHADLPEVEQLLRSRTLKNALRSHAPERKECVSDTANTKP